MPKIDEEYIEKKAKETWAWWWEEASGQNIPDFNGTIRFDFNGVKNLIRSLLVKPKVSKDFIGKVVARIYCDRKSSKAIKTHIREAFKEAGVEVEDG